MERYQPLYRFVVKHDYFSGVPCECIQCGLTPQGKFMARQRGLLFRQLSVNEWAVYFDENGAGVSENEDVLEMEMTIIDRSFSLYTEWEDYSPISSYQIELPSADAEEIETSSFTRLEDRRRIGSPFCLLKLNLTTEIMKSAINGTPQCNIIHFHAPDKYWEYLFIPRIAGRTSYDSLLLEDSTGKVSFLNSGTIKIAGCEACRIQSSSPIPLRKNFNCGLRLVIQSDDNHRSKRIILKQVHIPQLGRFKSDKADTLRQIRYY